MNSDWLLKRSRRGYVLGDMHAMCLVLVHLQITNALGIRQLGSNMRT